MADDLPLEEPLDLAIRRLERALSALEAGLVERLVRADHVGGDLFDDTEFEQDRTRLAAELDAARSREKALEEVAAEASAALGRAAAEVRAALAAGEH